MRRSSLRVQLLEDRLTPATITVNSALDDTTSGNSLVTLREAIIAANNDSGTDGGGTGSGTDSIVFASSLHGKTITLGGTVLPQITTPMTIQGPGANLLTIDGNEQSRILRIDIGNTVTISGLTLTRGKTVEFNGAAILNLGNLTLSNCNITNNKAVEQEFGAVGGAISNTGNLVVASSTFSGNTASNGGGAIDSVGNLTAINSTFSGNSTNGNGGAIRAFSNLTMRNSTVVLNLAGSGGGIVVESGTTKLFNSIVAGNTLGNGTTPNDISGSINTNDSLGNVIGNAGTAGGLPHFNGFNVVGNFGSGTLPLASIVNPTLAFNGGPTFTHAPIANGPAIGLAFNNLAVDANNNPLTTDQRGSIFVRASGQMEAGAVELLTFATLTVNSTADVDDANYSTLTLREALTLNNSSIGVSTINFNLSLSGKTITLNGTVLPAINDNVSIVGLGATLLTIDGNDQSQILQVIMGKTASFSGLRLTNGKVTWDFAGGAIFNAGTLTITGCTLDGNSAEGFGGAIENQGTLTILNSYLRMNSADNGGAIDNFEPSAILTIINTTFAFNSAKNNGGAIHNEGGTVTIRHGTIIGNFADADNNTTGTGGGIHQVSGTTKLFNSIVVGNVRNSTTLIANDITGTSLNTASVGNVIGSAAAAGGLTNNANNFVGISGSYGTALDAIFATSSDFNGLEPIIVLKPNSVILDRGVNAQSLTATGATLTTDQQGKARNVNLRVDAGAHEMANAAPTIKSAIPDRTFVEDAVNFVINLANHFTDTHDGGTGLTYTVTANSNGKLLTTAITTTNLTLDLLANATGATTITVRATDKSGVSVSDSFVINVTPVNDAPILNTTPTPVLPTIAEDSTTHTGINIATLLGTALTDADSGAIEGIAIIASTGTGTWQYRLTSTAAWTGFIPSATAARLLPATAFVRFLPAANFNGSATITYRGWDRTFGNAGATGNLSTFSSVGGATAFSTASEVAKVTITPVNDAPVLNTAPAPRFPNVPRNSTNPTSTTVAALLGSAVTDVDAGAKGGIAVIGLTGTTSGTWQYSLNGGSIWVSFTATTTTARLLRDTDRIRFVPKTNFTGSVTLQYRAWDQTAGSAGSTANVSTAISVGGSKAFSLGVETATVTVG